jgi:hypothetical protein
MAFTTDASNSPISGRQMTREGWEGLQIGRQQRRREQCQMVNLLLEPVDVMNPTEDPASCPNDVPLGETMLHSDFLDRIG